MTSSHKLLGGVLILAFALGGAAFPSGKKTEDNRAVSLPMEMVADYLHAVIEANREVYTKHVVERLQARGVVVASENWEYQKNTMPLPAQLLMESDRVLERNGSGIQYRLISQWPINKRNVASGEFQKNGLGAISAHPTKPFTGYVTVGQARYFQAVYPDLAVTEGCIGCHNAHPESAKHDFKLNDVIGAMVISIPVK